MNPWNLNDKEFHEWAVKRLADQAVLDQLEAFSEKAPPEELIKIYSVLDKRVIPILWANHIPIEKEEVFRMFRAWFVRRGSPTKCYQPDKTPNNLPVYVSLQHRDVSSPLCSIG